MKGIDISSYQTNVNFAKVKASGVEIVYIKATEGITYVSASFKLQYAQAKAAGLKVGFYHYLRANNPLLEAKHFLRSTSGLYVDCKHVIDVEVTLGQTSARISDNVRKFADHLISQGKEVGIYTGDSFYATNLNSTVKDLGAWIAHYGVSKPNLVNYAGFQYSQSGTVSGILGGVDVNIFNSGMLLSGIKNEMNNVNRVEIVVETFKYGIVTATSLNVRENGDEASTIIGTLKKGDKVRVGRVVDGWTNIYYGNSGAWVSSTYIDDGTVVAKVITPVKVVVKTNGIITATVLNVRSESNATSSIIGTLKKGTAVKIARKSNNFYSIYFGNHGGWISADFVK